MAAKESSPRKKPPVKADPRRNQLNTEEEHLLAKTSSDRTSVLERYLRNLAVLQRVSVALADTRDLAALYQQVVDGLAASLDYDVVSIYTLEQDKLYLQAVAGPRGSQVAQLTLDQGIVGQAARTQQIVFAPDVTQSLNYIPGHPATVAEAAVPIVLTGRVLGVLNIEVKQPEKLSVEELGLLEAMAAQVGIAIVNAQHYETLRQRANEVTTLVEVSQLLTGTLDLSVVLKRIAKESRRLLGADGVVILLLEEDKASARRFLRPVVCQLADPAEEESVMAFNVPVGQGISGRVAETGEGCIVNHAHVHPYSLHVPGTATEPESLLSVPLVSQGQVIGVMTLDRGGEREFVAHDLDLALSLARHAAIAVANARLFQQVVNLKEFNEQIVNSIQQGIVVLDDRGRVLAFNNF
ncbi:MAG TPA: GAF domain-containing protein, partial [Anaerolineae bacterium]|nr:GAF domain-containing protein [Anaerolineae bacterium]